MTNKDFYTDILNDSGDRFDVYEKILATVDEIIFDNNYEALKRTTVTYSTKIAKMVADMQLNPLDLSDIEEDIENEYGVAFATPLSTFNTIGDVVSFIFNTSKKLPKTAPKLDVKTAPSPVAPSAPVAAKPAQNVSDSKEYGLLLLPSLEEHGRIIVIQPITIDEAKEYINQFAAKVLKTKKTKNYDATLDPSSLATEHADYYHNVVDFNSLKKDTVSVEELDKELQSLTKSEIPLYRGYRPVFLSASIVGVGTTVVYNPNWATLNFSDYTIYKKLATLAEKYKA
jgi:hypothetical protein